MLDQYRSRDIIGQISIPLLIVHGGADQVIPFEQGRTLYDLAKTPKRLVRMVGSNHATLTRDGLYDQIWTFLNLPLSASTAEAGHRAEVQVVSAP
ncbi:hypothetical protein BH09PSE1_BH09PSE1_22320 [soil metagenome]